MNKYRKLFYSSAVALPLVALAATGVHAATSNTDMNAAPKHEMFQNMTLTDEQKTAVEQAKALRKQADDILVKAGLPVHHPMMGMKFMQRPELTAEQKATLDQAKALREAGKIDEAKALLEKAGFPAMPKFEKGLGHRMMRFAPEAK